MKIPQTSTLGHLILQTARLCIGEITFVYPRQDDPATLHVRRNLTGLTTVLRMPYDCEQHKVPVSSIESVSLQWPSMQNRASSWKSTRSPAR